MRLKGELTGVVLEPRVSEVLLFTILGDEDNEEEDDQNMVMFNYGNLDAHLVFLASTITFIRDSAKEWMDSGKIAFLDSETGAKALLDFAYTGDFLVCPDAPLSKRQSTIMLRELFGIADEWDMPDFMRLIESKIIFDFHLIEDHPDKHGTMLDQSVKYGATTLSDALVKFGKQNIKILDALERSRLSQHSD